ncbi:MAG: hypothetical protein MRZ79_12230 [Bacteroidia bacterium]|nr:hypothetical protein [Bacteroidia bacterium]
MNYLPVRKLTYNTKLSYEEVRIRLNEHVEAQKPLRPVGYLFRKKDHKAYEGFIKKENFQVSRIIHSRNSFIPQIKGTIEPTNQGSKIHVKMQLHELVLIFMAVWMGGTGLAFFAFLWSAIKAEVHFLVPLAPLGMMLFGYLLATIAFNFEADNSTKFFEKIWEAEIEANE